MLEEYDGSSTTLHFFGPKPVLRDIAYLFEVTRTMNRVQLKFLKSISTTCWQREMRSI